MCHGCDRAHLHPAGLVLDGLSKVPTINELLGRRDLFRRRAVAQLPLQVGKPLAAGNTPHDQHRNDADDDDPVDLTLGTLVH